MIVSFLFFSISGMSEDFTRDLISVFLIILIILGILITIRELVCWYFKLNKLQQNQVEMKKLLVAIAEKNGVKISEGEIEESSITHSPKFKPGDKVALATTGEKLEIDNWVNGKYICYSDYVIKGVFEEGELLQL